MTIKKDYNDSRYPELHIYDGLEEAPCMGENFLIPGPAGVLEAITDEPKNYQGGGPIAVICHPHPLYGGSMANKVVHIVSNTLIGMGIPTLRFNFRGVGHSEGRFDNGEGEADDLQLIVEWYKRRYPESPLWLAGFSFGSFVAFKSHVNVGAERLLLVAPPVNIFDFKDAPSIDIPWLVIQGGKDEIVAPERVSDWVQKQRSSAIYKWLGDADHFFHGRLSQIANAIKESWDIKS